MMTCDDVDNSSPHHVTNNYHLVCTPIWISIKNKERSIDNGTCLLKVLHILLTDWSEPTHNSLQNFTFLYSFLEQ